MRDYGLEGGTRASVLGPSASVKRSGFQELDVEDEDALNWKPDRRIWITIVTFTVLSVLVSLDAAIIGPVLPVSCTDKAKDCRI